LTGLSLLAAGVPEFTREAEHLLRAPGMFDWSTVTLLALAVYVYAVEVERANWSVVLAGLAFWLMDWANEIVNALVLHFNGHAALWTVTGRSSYVIRRQLPRDRRVRLPDLLRGVFHRLLRAAGAPDSDRRRPGGRRPARRARFRPAARLDLGWIAA
jgi:hypothetical protein